MGHLSKSEWGAILIGGIVLGFIFGFDDGREKFEVWYWLGNIVIAAVIGVVSLVIMSFIEKRVARKFSCDTEVKTWSLTRIFLKTAGEFRGPVKSVPLGVIVPCLFAIISNGLIKFAAVTSTEIMVKPARRIGFRFPQGSELEIAVMSSAGPVSVMLLGLLAEMVLGETHIASLIVRTNMYLGVANMVPLPGLHGIKVFFGAPLMYIFLMAMMVIIALSIKVIPAWASLLLGVILGIGVVGARHYTSVTK